jgi:diguanylate cyclase (GGDEF)-like protein/PAS domain S-box-containing protein
MNLIDNDRLLLFFKAIAENCCTVIGAKDLDGRYVYVNAEYSRLFHLEQEKFIGKTDDEIFPADIGKQFCEADLLAQQSTEAITVQENFPVNGEMRRYLSVKFPIRDNENKLWATGLIATDITEIKCLEAELRSLANIDMLTGCNTRRHLLELAVAEEARALRYGIPLTLIVFDVDHFKKINDAYGRAIGDRVLQGIAKLCRETLRAQDILGRVAGEEFCIILPHSKLSDGVQVGRRIQEKLSQFILYVEGNRSIHVTISIGIAELGESLNNLGKLLLAADIALYRAKNENRNCIRDFEESASISSDQ